MNDFNPVQSLLSGAKARQQVDVMDLQRELAQSGDGNFSPTTQKLAAYSSDPIASLANLDKSRFQALKDDAATMAYLVRNQQPEQALQLGNHRLQQLSKLGVMDSIHTQDGVDALQQGIQAVSQGVPYNQAFQPFLDGADVYSGLTQKGLKQTFGGQQDIVRDSNNNDYYATTERSPKGGIKTVYSPITPGAPSKPSGAIEYVNRQGQTRNEKITDKVDAAKQLSQITREEKLAIETASPKEQLDLLQSQVNLDEKMFKNRETKANVIQTKIGRYRESNLGFQRINDVLKDDRYKAAYGYFSSRIPESMQGEAQIEVNAVLKQVSDLLTVDARGKLKGQGTITDTETDMLRNAISILNSKGISPKAAKRELLRIRSVFNGIRRRNRVSGKSRAFLDDFNYDPLGAENSISDEDLLKRYDQ